VQVVHLAAQLEQPLLIVSAAFEYLPVAQPPAAHCFLITSQFSPLVEHSEQSLALLQVLQPVVHALHVLVVASKYFAEGHAQALVVSSKVKTSIHVSQETVSLQLLQLKAQALHLLPSRKVPTGQAQAGGVSVASHFKSPTQVTQTVEFVQETQLATHDVHVLSSCLAR